MAAATRRFLRLILCPAWLAGTLLLIPGCGADGDADENSESGRQGHGDSTAAVEPLSDVIEVQMAGENFELELAMNDADRQRGLMHRDHMDPDHGMLFVFPDEDEREFWMKNTRIDLDVLFLDRNGRIVSTDTMMASADPLTADRGLDRARSGQPAQFVIELNRGTVYRLGLKPGDRIDLPVDRLKARAE